MFGSFFERTIYLTDNVSLLHSLCSFSIFSNTLYGEYHSADLWYSMANRWIAFLQQLGWQICGYVFFTFAFSLCPQTELIRFCVKIQYMFSLVMHFVFFVLSTKKYKISGYAVIVYAFFKTKSQWKRVSDHHEARRQVKIDIGSIINSFVLFYSLQQHERSFFIFSWFILLHFCCDRHGKSFIHSEACRHHMK